MGERKVLNKYYPSDFNPAKIPRRRQPNNQQMKVRMMLPMSIRCQTCGNYIYKGTKFNSRKEDVVGETYLGIQIFRFYFKCTKCSAEITYRTDPQNSDYTVESGASRNFEPWRKEDESVDRVKRRRVEEEMNDVMQSLEKRSHDCKREMDILSNIYEIKSIKSIHEKMNLDSMIEALNHAQGKAHIEDVFLQVNELEEEDAALVKSIVFHRSQDYVHRINDEEMDEADNLSNNARKRRKGYQEIIPPTDYLSKTSFLDRSKRNGGAEPGIKLKPKIAVARKKRLSMRGQPESSVLQILSSNYDSGELD